MTDMIFGDRPKKIIAWMEKRVLASYDVSADASPDIALLYANLQDVFSNISTDYHRKRALNTMKIGVWGVMTKHMGESFAHDLLRSICNDDISSLVDDSDCVPKKMFWTDAFLEKLALYGCNKFYEDRYCNPSVVRDDLVNSGNEAILHVYRIIDDLIKKHDLENFRDYIEFFLWTAYKDTGWRDVFFYALNVVGNDEIKSLVSEYVREPYYWSMNVWKRSMETTAQDRKEGKIPPFALSYPEQVNVGSWQRKQLSKIIGQEVTR